MSRSLELCFDYLSPYAFLAWLRIDELCQPRDVQVRFRPVLLAGLLQHWGQLGPAEIPPKRRFVLRDASRIAKRRGVELRPPNPHPFHPLAALRVSLPEVAGEHQRAVIGAIFEAGWQRGENLGDPQVLASAIERAGAPASELLAAAAAEQAKAALRKSTDDAIALGVFGVPTMIYQGELFWGADQLESLADVLDGRDPIDARALDRAWEAPPEIVRPRR